MEHADLHFSPKRTTTNLYIVLIAVSDLLSAILVMPLVGGVLVVVRLVFGDVVCQFHVFFPGSLFVIYVFPVTMCLTAISRYVRMSKQDKPVQNMVFQEGPCVPGGFLDFCCIKCHCSAVC